MQWQTKSFNELSVHELYAILHLRAAVFAVEQNCVYLDPDNHDQASRHIMCIENGKLLAYCRIAPPGTYSIEWAICRVVTAPTARNRGLGQELVQRAIATIEATGGKSIRIAAQAYLQKFYTGHGFVAVSEPYNPDGIIHIEMLRSAA